MRGIQVTEYVAGPDGLKVSEIPDPVPADDQYLIGIHATAANFFDILQISGKYQHQPPFPWTAGSEFSGVIIAPPKKLPYNRTPKFAVGDRVFGGSTLGGFATKVAAHEANLRPVPDGWSFRDAAGLFVTAPTSYAALVLRAGVKQGDWVLVHAAAGGVGIAAVQIAKAFGATVVACAGTDRKLEVCRKFGADYVVSSRDEGWAEKVKELTEGRGVDIVYDPVGLIAQSMKCTAWNGRLLVIGFAGGELERMATNRILLKNVSVIGLHWGMYAVNEPDKLVWAWDGIFDLIRQGKYKGTVYNDREFVGLEDIPAALKALGARDTWGKVVVDVPQEGQSKL